MEESSRWFDDNKFGYEVTDRREIVTATAYAINRGDKKQIAFQNILRAIGFDVKLKPFISRTDGSSKGDWDNCGAYGVRDLTSSTLEAEATIFKPIDDKFLLR
ncbi:MAG: NYN domain-containing protein [Arenicellales bacterium]|nr:NYN domain-containing protein [Arenicellales bacterium]